MATKDADLSSLRINRSSPGAQSPPKSRSFGKLIIWLLVLVALLGAGIFLKGLFDRGVEVQLATASMSSPSQANAVFTASGYVVARRKAAVASKGTGTLVFSRRRRRRPRLRRARSSPGWKTRDVAASLQRARENLRVAEADLNEAKQSSGAHAHLAQAGLDRAG